MIFAIFWVAIMDDRFDNTKKESQAQGQHLVTFCFELC